MTQEEYNKIDSVRAMCMGFSIAIKLSQEQATAGQLRLDVMQERLQEGNKVLGGILNDYPELYQSPFKLVK